MNRARQPNAAYALTLALGFLAWAAAPAAAQDLEKQLLKEAPRVIQYLKDKGYHNVGVLKFRVKKGHEPVSDSAGTLNLSLASRLELALVLANDVRHTVGILHDASTVAAHIQGASHLTREGRKKLFETDYPLAWGKQKVRPDAFLTGVAQVSPDLKDLNVGILAFDKDGDSLGKVAQFTAQMDADGLVETGESFLLRGAFDSGKEELTQQKKVHKAVQVAAKVKDKEEDYPLKDEEAPVTLEVRYDGQKVPLEIKGGRAEVPEPQEGQKVSFVLKRKAGGKERYGVVLKINGENSRYKQRLKDLQCRKWVLEPGDGPVEIKGFQMTDDVAEEFRVLSRAESKAKEMYYGADVGTISITVFKEKEKGKDRGRGRDELVDLSDEGEDLAALSRGVFPKEPPQNLAALQVQLREGVTRGLIEGGDRIEHKIRIVPFDPDPIPVMSATIRYYRP